MHLNSHEAAHVRAGLPYKNKERGCGCLQCGSAGSDLHEARRRRAVLSRALTRWCTVQLSIPGLSQCFHSEQLSKFDFTSIFLVIECLLLIFQPHSFQYNFYFGCQIILYNPLYISLFNYARIPSSFPESLPFSSNLFHFFHFFYFNNFLLRFYNLTML